MIGLDYFDVCHSCKNLTVEKGAWTCKKEHTLIYANTVEEYFNRCGGDYEPEEGMGYRANPMMARSKLVWIIRPKREE